MPPLQSVPLSPIPDNKGRHYDLIKERIDPSLSSASLTKLQALGNIRPQREHWFAATNSHLAAANTEAWHSQNAVDHMLDKLQDIYSFAEPLLREALKEQYRIETDVRATFLRLYIPKEQPWYVVETSAGVTARTVSLLDAALHNFARSETFEADSEFITRPDVRGHFDVAPIKHKMSVGQFQTLCRELDLGARYQRHLQNHLLPTSPVAAAVLRHKVTASQQAALKVAAHIALAKKDISYNAHSIVLATLTGQQGLTLGGKVMQVCNLCMMDTTLTGILLFAPVGQQSRGTDRVIVYVPHDPDHPLKEYAAASEFMAELTRQLREDTLVPSTKMKYRQIFSQFIDQQQRGHFFAGLEQRLNQVTWHEKQPLDPRPTWRETPLSNPNLQFSMEPINGLLWEHCYRQSLNKILNDAREIAVSTADTDSRARWAWWDNFKKILSDTFNVALMVVTPFVPGLGELMLAYTAYQLTNSVIEGVVDLAEGLWAEAAEHVIGVVTDIVQLAAFAAGAAIGNEFRLKLSPFIEGTKPVQLPNGENRLWSTDLTPYAQKNTALAQDSKPDVLGLHRHGDRHLLPLNEGVYAVEKDSVTGDYRVRHPHRPDAYAPKLSHNGRGAWVHEGENPRLWDSATLMKRIGRSTDGFSAEHLENIRIISGIDEGSLRRMHVENAPPPLLLDATLKRFKAPGESPTSTNPKARELQSRYPILSSDIAEALLTLANGNELEAWSKQQRLPLNLEVHARECVFEIRLIRAFEGVYENDRLTVDTERLMLNVLRLHTDTYNDLRIEVRDGSFEGGLRCSVGPDNAATVRVLARSEQGDYEIRDADNRLRHEAADLYESILRAMPAAVRWKIGYRPGQGQWFKEWLITKAEPPAERRTALLEPPVRPVAEPQLALLLRGPAQSREGATLEERVSDLYPHMSERQIDAFVRSLNAKPDPAQAIKWLEDELGQLRNTLQWWQETNTPTLPDEPVIPRGAVRHIADRLLACFERKSWVFNERSNLEDGYVLDLSSELLRHNLDREWRTLPDLKSYLDQVKTLSLDNVEFSEGTAGLLKDFRHLRQFSARRCDLTRLPEDVGKMHFLKTLRLNDNRIELTPDAVEHLKNLTRMETLRLDNNPLGRAPNVERMPLLKVLGLEKTGIVTWPEGVFSKPRPRGFFINLQDNPLAGVPEVVPGSQNAWIIARARLSEASLPTSSQFAISIYRQSVGLAPHTLYLPAAENARSKWPVVDDSDLWGTASGLGAFRPEAWDRLISEPHAEGFFSVIDNLTQSSDYRAGGEWRQQLSRRVWDMIDAIDLDTDLREELFTMAAAPTNCADAGAQLFNNMGIKVLVSRAYSYSTDHAPLEKALVRLAKGASRLERVDQIAAADVMARDGDPDVVEVYLAYETALADRLGLPWQSESMLYRPIAGVSDSAIAQAFDLVIGMEGGDGLVNAMLQQPFWDTYLHETWSAEFHANEQLFERRADLIETLRDAQLAWANAADLPEVQKNRLRNRLRELARQVPIAEDRVFTGKEMTDQTYADLYSDLAYQKQELARKKTREALEH